MTECADLLAISADPARGVPTGVLDTAMMWLARSTPARSTHGSATPGLRRIPLAGGILLTTPAPTSPATTNEPRDDPLGGPFLLCRTVLDGDCRPVQSADLAARIVAGRQLAALRAPFAAATVEEDGRFSIAADLVGLRHVYSVQTPLWTAISTSASLLAHLAGAPLDAEALGAYRLTGYYLGLATPFAGVTKLPPGCLWRLADGALTTVDYGAFEPPVEAVPFDRVSAVTAYADTLRTIVNGCLDHDPETIVELSGGFDSRLLLAAVSPMRRRRLRALTITSPETRDGPIAMAIAQQYGMRHRRIGLRGVQRLTPAEAYDLVRTAAARHHCLGNPVSAAILDWVEQHIEPSARLTGVAGEMIRGGFFLQPARSGVEPALVDRITQWWIISNEAVPDHLLDADFAVASRASTRERLHKIFAEYPTDWRTATDLYYLRERVHRWAGINATGGCQSRTIVAPSLDLRLLRSAFAVPHEWRHGSRFAAAVMLELDRDLARMPMGSGVRPAALTRRFSLQRRLGENTVRGFTTRAASKLWQRVHPADHPPTGAASLAQLVLAHLREHPYLLAPALNSGLLAPDAAQRILHGRGHGPATVGFLVNLTLASSLAGRGSASTASPTSSASNPAGVAV